MADLLIKDASKLSKDKHKINSQQCDYHLNQHLNLLNLNLWILLVLWFLNQSVLILFQLGASKSTFSEPVISKSKSISLGFYFFKGSAKSTSLVLLWFAKSKSNSSGSAAEGAIPNLSSSGSAKSKSNSSGSAAEGAIPNLSSSGSAKSKSNSSGSAEGAIPNLSSSGSAKSSPSDFSFKSLSRNLKYF